MKYISFMLSFLSTFLGGVIVSDSTHFKTVSYKIKTKKITKDCRIIVLADLHEKMYGNGNQELIQSILKAGPDCIIMAGDMITAGKEPDLNPVGHIIYTLSKKVPVYYAMGNHELKLKAYPERYKTTYENFCNALKSCGAKIIDDKGIYLPGTNVKIYGLSMDMSFYKKKGRVSMDASYLQMHLGNKDKYSYRVLVGHNPEFFEAYSEWGADLVVSGHLHGGFMRLPFGRGLASPRYKLFPKYAGGCYHKNKTNLVVSRGLGMHTLPLRIFNPGELVVIDLMQSPRRCR